MACVCNKPDGSCGTCPHYRFDREKRRFVRFAPIDPRDGKEPIRGRGTERPGGKGAV